MVHQVIDEPREREHEDEIEEQLDRVGGEVGLAIGDDHALHAHPPALRSSPLCMPVCTPLGTPMRRRYRAGVHAVAYEVEIRIPGSQSLKDRRQVVRSILAVARERFHISAAEVGGQDTWQRATLGFAVVASEARLAEAAIDELERYLWSRPEIDVIDSDVRWLD